jgi:multisubunit Na+/H+ antiporter MnhG subunit
MVQQQNKNSKLTSKNLILGMFLLLIQPIISHTIAQKTMNHYKEVVKILERKDCNVYNILTTSL